MSVLCNSAVLGGAVDTGDIGHSLRFRGAQYLSRTPGSAGNLKTWTISLWVKRGALSTASLALFGTGATNVNDTICYYVSGGSGDAIDLIVRATSVIQGRLTTNQVFRDPQAFAHIVFAYNSPDATASERMKLYVNGTRVTSFSAETQPAQNTDTLWNTARALYLGRMRDDSPNYLDGYLSRVCFVDGSALTPSSFGYLNTEINEWVSKSQSAVKAVVDAGGTNSFMLDFDDPNFATYNVGKDFSSKGNHWTPNNFSLTAGTTYDHMLDVPGNSFATLNPLWCGANVAPTDGNLKNPLTSGSPNASGPTQILLSGKGYAELHNTAALTDFGMCITTANLANMQFTIGTTPATGLWEIYDSGGGIFSTSDGSAFTGSLGATRFLGATVKQFAWDTDTGKFWIGKDDVWYDSSWGTTGNPSTGANPTFTISASRGPFSVCAGSNSATNAIYWLFGQAPLHASATYDSAAGGYFRYAPPTGFKALCQRNMPDPAILNPKNGFVSVLATEDNIYSTLASARSGWTDYVDILKNRAASESWAWQFSHDSSNEYAVAASSLVRQTKRTQSGSNNWVGYSIRIGATYGTAAGSVSHTNGVATTITHNVGKSARQLILLFNRAGGSAVPVYHPDLTSGELLNLCTTAADAASTAITSVGMNSFQIGSATATGTYDYLVCSEISQFFDLGKWTGNAAADGVYYNAGHKPKVLYAKALSTTDDHRVYDDLRPGYNVQGGVVLANTNAAETTAAEMDITAFGMKARITTTPNAAQTYVTANWASSSGKYSLGR